MKPTDPDRAESDGGAEPAGDRVRISRRGP